MSERDNQDKPDTSTAKGDSTRPRPRTGPLEELGKLEFDPEELDNLFDDALSDASLREAPTREALQRPAQTADPRKALARADHPPARQPAVPPQGSPKGRPGSAPLGSAAAGTRRNVPPPGSVPPADRRSARPGGLATSASRVPPAMSTRTSVPAPRGGPSTSPRERPSGIPSLGLDAMGKAPSPGRERGATQASRGTLNPRGEAHGGGAAPEAPDPPAGTGEGSSGGTRRAGALGSIDQLAPVDGWQQRASWLEGQAHQQLDAKRKARTLTLASELWAIAGDLERSRACAGLAVQANPHLPVAQRQARWLAAAQGDWNDVSAALDAELKLAVTPEARCHAAHLAAHVRRGKLGDRQGASTRIDLAARAKPDDVRSHLARLLEELSAGPEAPRTRFPDLSRFEHLIRSVELIIHLRGGTVNTSDVSPAALLENLRRALRAHDAGESATAALALSRVPDLEAAMWLAAALYAQSTALRPRALELLEAMGATNPSTAVTAAVTELAWLLSDPELIDRLKSDASRDAIPIAQRLGLALVAAAPPETLRALSEEASGVEGMEVLVDATADFIAPGERIPSVASPSDAASLELGYALAAGRIPNEDLSQLAEASVGSIPPLHVALAMERALASGDVARCASLLRSWPEHDARLPTIPRLLVEGLLYERAEMPGQARQPYDAALALDPSHEGAARALAQCPDAAPLHELLESLADVVSGDDRCALLLMEAARRRGPEDPVYGAILNRAAEISPGLPFAFRAAEHAARARGDAQELLSWLQRRRETLTDPLEQALDSVREALLVASYAPEQALGLIERALAARPYDVALRELHERMLPTEMGLDRFAWRESVAAALPPQERAWLLLGLAREHAKAGDKTRAAELGQAVLALDPSPLTQRIAERLQGSEASSLLEQALARANAAMEGPPPSGLDEAAADLLDVAADAATNDPQVSAMLRRFGDLLPESLPLLRWAEHTRLGSAELPELESLAERIARVVEGAEAEAHWRLALRIAEASGSFARSSEVFQRLLSVDREWKGWFRIARVHYALPAAAPSVQHEAVEARLKTLNSPLDRALLASVAAQAELAVANSHRALDYLNESVTALPGAQTALRLRAEVLMRLGRPQEAAEAFELEAAATGIDKYRAESLRRAGLIWLDRLGNAERATAALEQALEALPKDDEIFEQLRRIYVAHAHREKLVTLIERRLELAETAEARAVLELMRARAWLELGHTDDAKEAVQQALTQDPESEPALELLASLCQSAHDFAGECAALVRLLALRSTPDEQAALQRRLGQLYAGPLNEPEKAQKSFEAALRTLPSDFDAGTGLANTLAQSGQPESALELLNQLIERSPSPESKRDFTLALGRLQARLLSDPRVAERTFERARRKWSGDATVLRTYAEFLRAQEDEHGLDLLLERASSEARRALATGRFQVQFFDSLEAVAKLREDESARVIVASSLAALRGEELTLDGAGAAALDDIYDDLLAPEALQLPMRALLRKAGHIIEHAYPFDLESIAATELEPESREWNEQLRAVAESVGVVDLRVLQSERLGHVCVAAACSPPTVVFGTLLLNSSDVRARDFLFARATKLLQVRASSLANASPIELWPMIAAFLSAMAPDWSPTGLDTVRFAAARSAMSAAVDGAQRAPLADLAAEVAHSIGNRASQMGQLVNQWAARSALLAIGSPAAALRGLACTFGHPPAPPAEPAERLKWVTRHAEARDIMSFSTTEAYAEARRRVGLGATQ